MPHKSSPPKYGFDENGKPLWGENQLEHCRGHGHYMHRSLFSGVEWVQYYCKECLSKKRKEEKEQSQKPKENPLAYTHMIKRRSDGAIFKHHVLNGSIPKDYVVFYKVKTGFDLPKKFKGYPVYEHKSSDKT